MKLSRDQICLIRILFTSLIVIVLPNSCKSLRCIDKRLRSGICTTLAMCPQLVEEFYNTLSFTAQSLNFQTFLSESICGFNESGFLICCANRSGSQLVWLTPSTSTPQPQQRTTPHSAASTSLLQFSPLAVLSDSEDHLHSYENFYEEIMEPISTTSQSPPPAFSFPTSSSKISDKNCGKINTATNRVVGGVEAKRGAYPWIAALSYRDDTDANLMSFLCGGALITNKHVLTSAHCIGHNLKFVRLGAHNVTDPFEDHALNYAIKKTTKHEGFEPKTLKNDIAIIELSLAVDRSKWISPICLPESSTFLQDDFVGMQPFIAGWGAMKHKGTTSDVLRDAQVPIVNRHVCEKNYKSGTNYVSFSEKLLCAGSAVKDACNGDSGGPLMLPQANDGDFRFYLLGVVSFGYECARPNYPGIYTRVASYIPWIQNNL